MNYIDLEKRYIFQTYKRVPVVFVKGKDSYLYDENGNEFEVDFIIELEVAPTEAKEGE